MSILTLKDRMEGYQASADLRLLPKLPVITCINGRSFSRLTSLLGKPFCPDFSDAMIETAHKLCEEVEGVVFAYVFNDEIVLVSRNDQNADTTPWFDNRVQKMASACSSIATLRFSQVCPMNLVGEGVFTAAAFVVPNLAEAINAVIFKQQHNFHLSVQFACFYELLKKHDRHDIRDMLAGLSLDEKIDLLGQECSVSFEELPLAFRRGVALYRVPKVIGETIKSKWAANMKLPVLSKEQEFLGHIFRNGVDILRKESM